MQVGIFSEERREKCKGQYSLESLHQGMEWDHENNVKYCLDLD